MPKITFEATFEEHIAQRLLTKHEYLPAVQDDYDRTLCMRPKTVIEFIRATQPKKWAAYCEVIGDRHTAEENILKRIKEIIDSKGSLHLLRKGFDIHGGGHFEMCFFQPTSGVAEESTKLFKQNLLHVQRQLYFSIENEKSLDLAIFLNGLPIFTCEVKNQQSGQNVWNAIKQYKEDRDPKEPLFRFRRCLAHFAVDNDQVYMTTELAKAKTFFLPFNRGNDGGAGNEPSLTGFASSYLWEETWSKTSILDLIQRFIRVVDVLDDKGKATDKQKQIFPRFHQLTSVRALTDHAKANGAGKSYLNQHSAGSGKTNCIAWLANSLATLHGKDDKPVFSSVIVISDRRVIDRQLQRTLTQVIETKGMLVNIDPEDGKRSKDLKQALQDGKRIVVTTLQKFGVIVDGMKDLAGETFAVIVDEAHSSQAGESAAALQKVLSYSSLKDEDEEEKSVEERIADEIKRRGPLPNVSYFAFTATPKEVTLELFGTRQPDGTYRPFSLYSMRQAIEEGFILDVLKNYTTYDQYWALLKKVKDDPKFEEGKAKTLLKRFVSQHEQTIERKVKIMVDHFMSRVQSKIGGKAKAMIVTSSRLHAVRYKLAIDKYLAELGHPFTALVAFTDKVKDPADKNEYTEAGMNGFPETATADRFESDEYRFLIVASKFQTGFDQPKLLAMYVDRKLQGVTCVQTLSRLNRTYPSKDDTFVLDFENHADDIEKAFQPYYDRIVLAKDTNPNKLYDIHSDLAGVEVYTSQHIEEFSKTWFAEKPNIARLHALADPVAAEWKALDDSERADFKSKVRDYVKLYAFLTQLVKFGDANLEKLFVFLRFLLPKIVEERKGLPHEIAKMVDIEKLAIRRQEKKDIGLKRGEATVNPLNYGGGADITEEEHEALSEILKTLNTRFGTTFTEDEVLVLKGLEKRLSEDEALKEQLRNGSRDAVRASFNQVAIDAFEDLVEDNFKFYKKVKDDSELSKDFFGRMFDWYYKKHGVKPGADRV